MSSHVFHAPIEEGGLNDDCPRCVEHAREPWTSLDTEQLARLVRGPWLTETDRRAARRLSAWLWTGGGGELRHVS